ncbi:MAG: helix-turn-helix domain-containing protein [Fimbriimonadaceae bacterium]|nr:helix-turn-helix domain-containing protein [Fimbriimonadaceae bacterium]
MAEHIGGKELKAVRKRIRFTQQEMADHLGVGRSTYANWESGQNDVPDTYLPQLRNLGLGADVGIPQIPASQLLIPLPFIGLVNAASPATWSDPNETDSMEFVPAEMGESRGRFAARVESDCMYPLLHPDDIIVVQQTSIPKIGLIVIFRTDDGKITLKQLKHDGAQYILHALNPNLPDVPAQGSVVGYLVGIVRMIGRRRITDYDPDGIRP